MSVYPLLTWLVSVPAFTVDVTIDGVTETLSVPDGVYYGWLTTGTETTPVGALLVRAAATGSLAEVLAAVIATHTQVASCDGYYGTTANAVDAVTTGSGNIGIALVIDAPADAEIAATSNVAALALFGLAINDLLVVSTPVVNRRTAGVWRPAVDGTRCEPVYQAGGTGAWSPYDPASHDRVRTGDRLVWTVTWPYVEASDITREVNGLADYLPLANRAPGDTNGTLDDVIYAASQDLELTLALPPIGTAAIDYRTCILPVQADLNRDAYTTEESVGARRYRVVMALLQAGSYGGV